METLGRGLEELVSVDDLVPWRDNPRQNDAASYEVQQAIERYGFLDPLLVRRETREVIAGHTRLKAAQRLGMTEVPVIWLDIDEEEAHKLAILHNRVAEREVPRMLWDWCDKLREIVPPGLAEAPPGLARSVWARMRAEGWSRPAMPEWDDPLGLGAT